MTQIALSEAKGRLTALARRAEEGEIIVLTRHGRAVAQITAVNAAKQQRSYEERLAALNEISRRGAIIREKYGLSGKKLQDDLYDENGWPV